MAPDGRRWRRLSPNGNNIGNGGQGYSRTIDIVDQIVKTQKPPYLLRNLITGNEKLVLAETDAQQVAEAELVRAGEDDELDVPAPEDRPNGSCMTFDAVGDNLTGCANCRQPFWVHTHRATTYGNQRIGEDEKRAARDLADRSGLL